MITIRCALVALLSLVVLSESHAATQHPLTQASDSNRNVRHHQDAGCRHGQRGRLVRFEQVASYSTAAGARAYFDEWIAFYQDYYAFPPEIPVEIRYGFDSYKVTYCTIDVERSAHSEPRGVAATGMLSVPRKRAPLSTVLYLHGTSVSYYDAVSNPNIAGLISEVGESFDGPPSNSIFAGAGFIYVAPDYLGLGDSSIPRHRYFHAPTEASAAVDMLTAARKVLEKLKVKENGKLFTFGFSQGGHAALASHRELEKARVKVAGTATVGGVFDVERWFLSNLENDATATLPLYTSYIVLAYDDIYDTHRSTSQVFRKPYAKRVDALFDMHHYFDDVLAGLPSSSRELFTLYYYSRITTDPSHPLRVRLRDNAVDRWRPHAPVRIYHSLDDEEVPYEQAIGSVERMRHRGAHVSVHTLSGFDHVNSWIQAMPRGARWFRSLE